MVSKSSKNFMGHFSVAGRLCILTALIGCVAAAFGPQEWYQTVRLTQWSVATGSLSLTRSALDWINLVTGTLLVFVVGLETKRMLLDGELTGGDRLRLPLVATLGVMLVPLVMFAVAEDATLWWLTAAGMDMAFALAVLGWFGERVPDVLKGFVCTLALFVCILCVCIGAGWTLQVPGVTTLGLMAASGVLLLVLNRMGVVAVSLYLVPAGVLWLSMLDQPLPALAVGLLVALFIPFHNEDATRSPLLELEQDLLPVVCFVLLPVAVLINAGSSWSVQELAALSDPAYMALLLCFFPGKGLGVFAMCWLGARVGVCSLPPGVDWKELGGASLLCGVGFFANFMLGGVVVADEALRGMLRLTVAAGGGLSLLSGAVWLAYTLSHRRNKVIVRS